MEGLHRVVSGVEDAALGMTDGFMKSGFYSDFLLHKMEKKTDHLIQISEPVISGGRFFPTCSDACKLPWVSY